MPAFDRSTVEFPENAAPVPLAYLLFGTDFFPSVTKFRENRGERYELRLIRQVAI